MLGGRLFIIAGVRAMNIPIDRPSRKIIAQIVDI